MCNVAPKPPVGFKDFLMVNATYILEGNVTSTLSVPMVSTENISGCTNPDKLLVVHSLFNIGAEQNGRYFKQTTNELNMLVYN